MDKVLSMLLYTSHFALSIRHIEHNMNISVENSTEIEKKIADSQNSTNVSISLSIFSQLHSSLRFPFEFRLACHRNSCTGFFQPSSRSNFARKQKLWEEGYLDGRLLFLTDLSCWKLYCSSFIILYNCDEEKVIRDKR